MTVSATYIVLNQYHICQKYVMFEDLTEVELNVVLQSISLQLSPLKTLLVRAKGLGERKLSCSSGRRGEQGVEILLPSNFVGNRVALKEEEDHMDELFYEFQVQPDSQDSDSDTGICSIYFVNEEHVIYGKL